MSASLEKGVNALKQQVDSSVAAFFSSCVHCGMCADACLFQTETGNLASTPIAKAEPLRRVWKSEYTLLGRIGKMFGLSKKVDEKLLTEWETMVYDNCTLCGRCSMVCPVGNDIALMIRKTREGMAAAGHAPEGLIGATNRSIKISSPMGVKLPALLAQIRHLEEDTGLKVPVDVEGAEYMLLLSSMEIMNFPEFMEAIARIFDKAGATWTISSEAFEATNSGIQIGVSDLAAELVQRVVDAAEKLKVKTVISPECGHAYMAIRWDGPNLVGKAFSFKVRHILEVLDTFREEGRLKLKDKISEKVTYHDPCQISRRGGVIDQPRRLIDLFADDFVEMPDAGKMNWCCGAGGGVSSNERADEVRLQVFKRKKAQLEEVQPDAIISACSNCRIHIEDGLEEYGMDIPLMSLTETLAEHLADD
ncbi:heterodisulfide reductase [Solemya velum gill symbiont]|uniref:Heterodisulfide reductase n=2 Tax=Solemya velum gill symbiont TaxID=2340 RepID=A0A1T2DQ06_SOVGS|nr:heterodisulfide reductase [Solemya velum gill symbiont]OOY36720.1 heterodisulfide reductase [Solemya velum gill symbiont]OOY48830.1 heterodisulfide reductase [Solemya velum gill symbiont]OOY49167.1 heterodisulfide reductase [Solemya velum gill symbiont]